MPTPVRPKGGAGNASGVQPDSNVSPSPLESLSPLLTAEVGAALERILMRHKPIALGEKCDRKRSTVYRWASDPGEYPVGCLGALASLDPDTDFLVRFGGHALAVHAARALHVEAQRKMQQVFTEFAPGKWGR